MMHLQVEWVRIKEKDGFCYLSHGRRNLKILVQAKFNNNSSGINVEDYSKMATNATGMDCKGSY